MTMPIKEVVRSTHHEQLPLCSTRPAYRQGRKLTAVKVYTISDESKHILLIGVPAIGLQEQVKQLCGRYGDVLSVVFVPNYSEDEFSDVFHIQYSKLQSSRFAKRMLDGKEFYGGVLQACYIPEMESVNETREKLIQRRKEVASRVIRCAEREDAGKQSIRQYKRKPVSQSSSENKSRMLNPASLQCIWKGQLCNRDPRSNFKSSNKTFGPHLPDPGWREAGVLERYLLPKQRKDPSIKPATSKPLSTDPGSSASTSSKPAALQFIPRQVKGVQRRIIFHKNKKAEGDSLDTTVNTSAGDKSLDSTIQAIRNRIREVSVPNLKIHVSGRKDAAQEVKKYL